jgi:hypothetical protein
VDWAAIIAAIIRVLGPVLAEALKQLLERLLSAAAAQAPAPAGPEDVELLFTRAIRMQARPGRKALLRAARRVARARAADILAGAAVPPPTPEEAEDLATAAGYLAGDGPDD